MNYIQRLPGLALLGLGLGIITLLGFGATAFAADTATSSTDSSSLLELLKPVYDAVTAKNYALAGALGLVALVALIKRYLGGRIPWLHSDAGGATTTLLMAFGTAMATSLAPGAHLSFDMAKGALLVAFAAAGGYAMLKKLLAPLLESLSAKAPPWAQVILRLVLWVFDKPAARDQVLADASKAGDTAVAANPAGGITAVTGASTDVN